MSDLEKQKILVLFGGGFFLAGGLMIYLNNPLYSIALFMLSALLIGVAAVGPDSIKTLGFKWGKDGGHIGFDRYQPTESEREIVLELAQDNPSPEIEEKGEKFIEKAKKRTPEQRSPEDYLALATEKWRAKDYDAALADVYAGLALNPEDVRTKATLIHRKASIFYGLGQKDEAIKQYKEAMTLDREFSWPHINLGSVYQGQGKMKEAEAEYKKAIELDPNDANPHIELGNVYQGQGKMKEAEAEYKKAIDLDPNDANPHISLGNIYYNQGKLEEAEAEYKKAIELAPNDAGPHNNLGNVYMDQGKLDEAKEKYEEALRLDPGFNVAKENLELLKRKMEKEK